VVGISEGAGMTNTLVCQAADVFAAAAPDSLQLQATTDQCRPSRPVSLFEYHAYEDLIIPYNGGGFLGVPSAPESLRRWSQIMGCTGDPEVTQPPAGSGTVQTYRTCSAGTQVGLASIHGAHGLYVQFRIQEFTWVFLTQFTLPLTTAQLNACPGAQPDPPDPPAPNPGNPGTDASTGGGGGGGCVIATAVYGSPLDPRVAVLREFRDKHLLTNRPGRIFVALYYRYSPPVAAFIERREVFRVASREMLSPLVCAIEHPYAALTAAFFLGGFILLARRRRGIGDRGEE
jgi:hypothetical protein